MAKREHKCGIYAIEQIGTDRYYIGSSADIGNRWWTHRRLLDAGQHHSQFLQNAWAKHGSAMFTFRVLEECHPTDLIALEQEYIDALRPAFNICPIAGSRAGSKTLGPGLERVRAGARRRSERTTHCPKGHPYTPERTYLTSRNQRVCLECARIASIAKHQHTTRFRIGGPVCQKGHEWTPENTRMLKNGTRRCIACAAERQRTKNERNRERYNADPAFRDSRRADYTQHREERIVKMRERGHEASAAHRAERLAAGTFRKSDTCRKGHHWTPENTLQWKDKRLCRTCHDASRAMTPEEHAAHLARRNERERAGWRDAYQRRAARLKEGVARSG